MAEYIEREAFLEQKREQYCKDCTRRKGMRNGKYKTLYEIGEAPCRACGIDDMLNDVEDFPAADVLPRDEGIKLGAELAAMHGATPEQQQLEEAYLKGVEYGMTRRDVRPVVRGKWIKYAPYNSDMMTCSECEKYWILDGDQYDYHYCPNCGADMRGEQDV